MRELDLQSALDLHRLIMCPCEYARVKAPLYCMTETLPTNRVNDRAYVYMIWTGLIMWSV